MDKKSYEDGHPVRLCNYTDVYYNDFIADDMKLMTATATRQEIRRFQLREGDVIITKDSESWDDIAVPACVTEELTNVICGYHLSLFRPHAARMDGRFLLRVLQAQGIREQFWIAANGVTRFGLGQLGMKDALLPVPPLPIQHAIADFLDRKTAAIDALIEKKQKLLDLLAEKRAALINQAVTKGLDPGVPMKDSGISWIGEIPVGWEVKRVRHALRISNELRLPISRAERAEMQGQYPYWGPTGVLEHIDHFRYEGTYALIGEDGDHFKKHEIWPMTQWSEGRFNVNNHAHVLASGRDCGALWFYWSFRHRDIGADLIAQGVSRLKLTRWALSNLWIPVPSKTEQSAIIEFVERALATLETVSDAVGSQVSKLHEYRQALITAAVTGQFHIPGEAA